MSDTTVRVKMRTGLSGSGWSCERGDEIDVSLPDARRLVARGLAGRPEKDEPDKHAYDKAMKMTNEERAEARAVEHNTPISEALRIALGLPAPRR